MSRRLKLVFGSAVVAAGLLAVGALALTVALVPEPSFDEHHCVVGHAPPRTVLIALDVSDPLVAVHPREVSFDVDNALLTLKAQDRALVIDAAGVAPSETVPVVDQCHPGDDDNTARNEFRDQILSPIKAHIKAVRQLPPSPESPIIETIVNAASDPSVHGPGTQLDIYFLTDGLQNSPYQSAYRRGSVFPSPSPGLLRGVMVELDILRNERDVVRQPVAVDRLVAWLTAAGATVRCRRPAWLLVVQAANRHRRRMP